MVARVNELTPERRMTNLERQFYMAAFALYVTGAPQLIAVREGESGSGHSLVCYAVNGTTLSIADPNYPDKTNITMPFQKGELGPYKSAQSTRDIKAGNYKTYNRVYYGGDISFFNLGKLQTLWTAYESGGLYAGFPPYTIKATELDEKGAPLGTYSLDRTSSKSSATRRLRFELESAFNGRLTVYEYGSPPSIAVPLNEVTLTEGDNYIGFLVEEKKGERWEWAGFDWVHIYRPGAQEEQDAAIGDADYNYCSISIDFDGVFIDKDTGEERRARDSIGTSAYGTFSGGTFTASWAEAYEIDPPMQTCTGYRGHITVTIDPDTLAVTSFDFLDETTYTCNGLFRYAATGSGPNRYAGGLDETHLFCSGRTDDGLPQPSIIWEENEPEPGEDCSGFRTYQLVSAENFDVLIQLMEQEPGLGPPGG
jgi:hypothetical protein